MPREKKKDTIAPKKARSSKKIAENDPPPDDDVISLSSGSVEEPITPAKRKRIPSSKAAAGTSDYPSKVSKGRALVSSDEETSRKKPKSANRIAPVADEFSDPESVNVSVVEKEYKLKKPARITPNARSSAVKPISPLSSKIKGKQRKISSPTASSADEAASILDVAPSSKVVVKSGLPGTPTDWEDSSDDDHLQPANPTPTATSRGAGYNPSPTSIPSPSVCEVMNNELVKLSMDKNLRDTYEGLVNLILVQFTGYNTRDDNIEGLQMFRHWKKSMPKTFDLRFAKQIIAFARSGNYINLSRIDPGILYISNAGSTSGNFFTDSTGSLFLCLTSGRCVESHLVSAQHAPTMRGGEQNYWKFIDVSPHTVEFERLCAAAGMAARQRMVETNLIRGNALRFTTRSSKAPPEHSQPQGSGSSPYKSAAAVSGSASRLGRGISWNIGPFDTVPIFNAIGKSFSLDKSTLSDLAMAGLTPFEGEVPVGSMVLVGYTGNWWRPIESTSPKLTFSLNWVVVLGVPSN